MVDKELKTKFFNPCSSKLDEELEDELIEEVVELEEEEEDKNKVEFKNLPIDEFLLLILNTYQSNSNGNIKYADLTSLFQNNQYSDQIMDIINKYIHDFKSEDNKLRSEILEEMNRLILINREE